MDDPLVLVFVTINDPEGGRELVKKLIQEHWIACANLIKGVESIYRWKGEIHTDSEILMILKTRKSLISGLEKRVLELHPYEVCEFVVVKTEQVSRDYHQWILQST